MTPWTADYQAPLSMRFSRHGYGSGLPFPSLGDIPDPGIEPGSPALQANSFLNRNSNLPLSFIACNAGDLGSIPGLGRSLGEGTVTHSSILAWRIPWTKKPVKLQSMELQRVQHDWHISLSLFTFSSPWTLGPGLWAHEHGLRGSADLW